MNELNIRLAHRRYRPRLQAKHGWPVLTALIDLLFLLVMFMVLSLGSTKLSGIAVELPRFAAGKLEQVDKFVVSLTKPVGSEASQIYFQDNPVTRNQLAEELQKLRQSKIRRAIIIRADRSVPFDDVMAIMGVAENAGLSSFLATSPAAESIGEAAFEQ